MNNRIKGVKDKIATFGRELETLQKRKQVEILELKDAIN